MGLELDPIPVPVPHKEEDKEQDKEQNEPPGQWRQLALLTIGMVLSMSTWFSASAVLSQLQDVYGVDEVEGSTLTISVQIGFVVGAMGSAFLNLPDLVLPQHLFAIGSFGAAACNSLLLWTGIGIEGACVGRALTGMFLAGVYPSAMKSGASWFRRARGLALGALVGALSMGSALPHLFRAIGSTEWRFVVYSTSAVTVLGGVLVAGTVKLGPFHSPGAVYDPRQLLNIARDRHVVLAIAAYFGHMYELYACWAWYGVFSDELIELHGGSGGNAAAWLTFSVVAGGSVGCVVGGLASDSWGRTKWTGLCLAVSATASGVVGLTLDGPLWVTILVSLVWGFFVVSDSAQFSAIVTEVASDPRYLGTVLTTQLASGFSLTCLTIYMIPLLQESVGWRYVFSVLSLGPALGVLFMWALYRDPKARSKIGGGRG